MTSAAAHYFMTVCVCNRDPLLGAIDGEAVVLSKMGLVVREEWRVLPERFPMVVWTHSLPCRTMCTGSSRV